MNDKAYAALLITLVAMAGCNTTGSDSNVSGGGGQPAVQRNPMTGYQDPDYMAPGVNKQIDDDEEELRLEP